MDIAVINASSRVTAGDLAVMCAAIELQVSRDFAPAWGRQPAAVRPSVSISAAPPGSCVMTLLDSPNVAGALGYHEEQADRVDGMIFAAPVLDNGGVVLSSPGNPQAVSVASVLSHEVLEALADPETNLWADGPAILQGNAYAFEVCDPVENDSYRVEVPGADGGKLVEVSVSDFVLPSWFDPEAGLLARVDHLGLLAGPFSLRPGGYLMARNGPGSEKQVFGNGYPAWRQSLRVANPCARVRQRLARTQVLGAPKAEQKTSRFQGRPRRARRKITPWDPGRSPSAE